MVRKVSGKCRARSAQSLGSGASEQTLASIPEDAPILVQHITQAVPQAVAEDAAPKPAKKSFWKRLRGYFKRTKTRAKKTEMQQEDDGQRRR